MLGHKKSGLGGKQVADIIYQLRLFIFNISGNLHDKREHSLNGILSLIRQ